MAAPCVWSSEAVPGSGSERGHWDKDAWLTPAPSLTGCVIVGKLLNFSGPQFPPVQNGHNDSGYLRPAVRMWSVKSLAQGLAHGSGCVSPSLQAIAATAAWGGPQR